MLKLNKDVLLAILLSFFLVSLFKLNSEKAMAFQIEEPKNVIFDKSTNTIYLNSLTLKQKIAQMIVTFDSPKNKDMLQKMLIGGIHLGSKPTKKDFIDTINYYQDGATIPFFFTADMEGCINPFENFQKFPSLREIKDKEEAYRVGFEEGKLLKELGFSINFAPVVDINDTIWNCRNFLGSIEEIGEKASYYIKGLQDNGIIATSKHYPGKTLVIKDPHKHVVHAYIEKDDILPFIKTIENNVSAIMISHIIADGYVNSDSYPSVASKKLVEELRKNFPGLIITDEIRMLGLKDFYKDLDQMYIDVFKAGNDLILNFDTDPWGLYHMICVIENAVKNGEISEERINLSVIKILKAKGISVVY
jgi:beta-N-acetylhexosaminidase